MRNTCPAKVTGTDKKVFHNHFGGAKQGILARHHSLNNGSRRGTPLCFPLRVAPPGSIVFLGTSESFTVHFDNWDSGTEIVTPAKLPAFF